MIIGAPLFLLAALAAAIPVILHLINRQRAKDLPFSTLRFLKISVQKTRRRRRIQDLFLMLLRVAALLLIALGLANMSITNLSALWGGGASAAVAIVLDNSASMGVEDEGKPRIETALAAAGQIMDELKDKDQVALFLTGGPRFPEEGRIDHTQEKVYQILNQVAVSYERADLAVKVRQARKQLVKSKAKNKQIYVITDLQESCWEGLDKRPEGAPDQSPEELGEEEAKEQEIPVILVDCNRAPKPNVAVQKVTLEATVPVAGLPVKADAVLYNASPKPQQRLLELYVDGVKHASSPSLEVPSEGTKEYSFQFAFERGGLHRGEVRLIGSEDGCPLDNRRFFAMEVNQGIPVAIVKSQQHEIPYLNDTFYLEQALSPAGSGGWALRTTSLAASQLATETLSQYAALYLVNLPAPSAAVAERLREYVSGGGNLVWICGENVDPAAYNQMNEQAQRKLLPAPLLDVREPAADSGRDSWFIGQIDKENRALRPLAEPASLYQSVLVYKHVRIDAAAGSGAAVLARLDDGQPLLVQRAVERGKTIMLGTGAHVGWTNMPLRPIFLPLFAGLTFDMAQIEQTRHSAVAGSPIVLQFEDQNRPAHVEVVPPSGEMDRFETVDKQGQRQKEFRYPNTFDVGVYTVRMVDAVRPSQLAVSVNIDPDEAIPTQIARDELEKRFSPAPLVFAEDPTDLTSTFKLLREGESLWETFLWALLGVLIFETFVSNWFSPKKEAEDEQIQQLPPGMRRLAKAGRGGAAA